MASKTPLPPIDWKSFHPQPIVGVDEVGRGCLAGSVYACAVIINEDLPYGHFADSKKLTPKKRALLKKEILENHEFGIGFATVDEITNTNILKASLLAMYRAIEKLSITQGHVLVDGNQKIPYLKLPQTTIIQGDSRVPAIAAASIVAKVIRDEEIIQLSEKYPEYGFEKHKGYGTKDHKEAIKKWGPSPIHRSSFAGVKEFL